MKTIAGDRLRFVSRFFCGESSEGSVGGEGDFNFL